MIKAFGFLLIVILGFTACEGPMGPPGKDAIPTEWTYVDFTITDKMWELVGGADEIGSYYYCLFENITEITSAIYNDGAIFCNYRYKDDFGNDVQSPLPYTYYDIIVDEYNVEHPYAVQISYDVTPGTIAFKLVFSDFYTGDFGPPPSCKFRVTLVY